MYYMLTTILILMASFSASSSANPVKVSMFLLFYASILFFFMSQVHSSTWMPLIFYLLFMGGILMMFMILSSISPNEKTGKKKNNMKTCTILAISVPFMMTANTNFQEISQKMKYFTDSNGTMCMATSMIVLYFLFFINMIAKEKTSMRAY